MDFEVEYSGSGYIVYHTEGPLKVESRQSTVTGAEGNDMRTKTNILVIVVRAIFFVRGTNHIKVSVLANNLRREHVAC